MKASVLIVPALVACQTATPDSRVPWLVGLANQTISGDGTAATSRRLADVEDASADCEPNAYEGIELVADVAPQRGAETIVASYAQGITVFDRENRVIAATPGYRCTGTADSIDFLVAGSAWGHPTIAVVATSGGHRETDTWISLFRIGRHHRLEATFAGTVETRRGELVERGQIVMLPEALLYRPPGGQPSLYLYESVPGVYLHPRDEPDHSEDDGPLGPVSLQ